MHAETVERMTAAAADLLLLLPAELQQKAQRKFADVEERENWHYVPRQRAGLAGQGRDSAHRREEESRWL